MTDQQTQIDWQARAEAADRQVREARGLLEVCINRLTQLCRKPCACTDKVECTTHAVANRVATYLATPAPSPAQATEVERKGAGMSSKYESMYARIVAIGKHVSVHEETVAGGRTTRYVVKAKRFLNTIGWIRWYGPWREWCFFPCEGTVWSACCIKDVSELIKSLNANETPILKPYQNNEKGANDAL